MKKKPGIVKNGILVTIGSLIVLAAAFLLYYLVFMLFESVFSREAGYNFVSPLRIGYGIVWVALCLFVYRTKLPELLKAIMLAGSLGTFMIGIGVTLYEEPILIGLILFLISAVGVYLLHLMKKEWYHYFAIVISAIAALFYL